MKEHTFKLPDLGEGLTEAVIQQWHIKESENVAADQLLLTVETDKSLVDIPAVDKGMVTSLLKKAGDRVYVGEAMCSILSEDLSPVVGNIPQTIVQKPAITQARKFKIHPDAMELAKELLLSDTQLLEIQQSCTIIQKSNINNYINKVKQTPMQRISQASEQRATSTLIDHAPINLPCHITSNLLTAIYQASQEHTQLKISKIGIAIDDNDITQIVTPPIDADYNQTVKTISQLKQYISARQFPNSWLENPDILFSNFGSIAGRYGIPLLCSSSNISVGVGQLFTENDHTTIPLTIVFDHAHITGGAIARFLKSLKEKIKNK